MEKNGDENFFVKQNRERKRERESERERDITFCL